MHTVILICANDFYIIFFPYARICSQGELTLLKKIKTNAEREKIMKNNTYIIGNYNRNNNQIEFYAVQNGSRYYIFSRKYKQSLYEYFKNGIAMRNLFSDSRAKRNISIANILEQLRSHLKYVEKENDIILMDGWKHSKIPCKHNTIHYHPESAMLSEMYEDVI